MKTSLLCLTVLASSGCLMSRSVVLPDSTPLLDAPEVTARWGVTELFVRSQAVASGGNDQRDYQELQEQLQTRLRRTLEAQTNLGHRREGAPLGVEVVVDVAERAGLNGWVGLGSGLETAVLLGGATVGMAVAGPPGSLLGMLVATPAALVVALLPPGVTELGEFEATVVLRRKSDGAVVATRHVRSHWRAEVNGFSRSQKLAKASGASIPELEAQLLETLREVLREVPTDLTLSPTLSPLGGEGDQGSVSAGPLASSSSMQMNSPPSPSYGK